MEKFYNSFVIPKDITDATREDIIEAKTGELLANLVPYIVRGKHYNLTLNVKKTDPGTYRFEERFDAYKCKIEIEEVPERVIAWKYTPTEELHLKKTNTIFERLRNAFKYITDTSGGKWSLEEEAKK